MSSHDESQQVTIYMKLDEYRWWVGLWGDSDGCVWLEVPNSFVAFFDRIDESGEHLHIYNNQKKQGYFSTLSKALAITTPDWSFNGTCKKIEK